MLAGGQQRPGTNQRAYRIRSPVNEDYTGFFEIVMNCKRIIENKRGRIAKEHDVKLCC
jgi:hypothetical protein